MDSVEPWAWIIRAQQGEGPWTPQRTEVPSPAVLSLSDLITGRSKITPRDEVLYGVARRDGDGPGWESRQVAIGHLRNVDSIDHGQERLIIGASHGRLYEERDAC